MSYRWFRRRAPSLWCSAAAATASSSFGTDSRRVYILYILYDVHLEYLCSPSSSSSSSVSLSLSRLRVNTPVALSTSLDRSLLQRLCSASHDRRRQRCQRSGVHQRTCRSTVPGRNCASSHCLKSVKSAHESTEKEKQAKEEERPFAPRRQETDTSSS